MLVHGTWGRGIVPRARDPLNPRWFEPGSDFEDRVSAALRERGLHLASTDRIEWSGANSIGHRDAAARLLAERLDALGAAHPSDMRLVIGHSHGGNVCVRAFAHLKGPADDIRVATVATPFVEVLEGSPDEHSTAMLIAWMAAFALLLRIGERLLGREPLSLFAMVVAAALIGVSVGLPLLLFRGQRLADAAARLADASSQAAWRAAEAPTLVLRGVDDEASLTLGFGAIATRLSHLSTMAAVGIAGRGSQLVFIAFQLGAIGLGVVLLGDRLFSTFKVWIVLSALAMLPIVVGGIVALALLEGIAPAVFGRELLLTFLGVQVNSNSAPDGGDHVCTVTLLPGGAASGLRHTLYAHPDCAGRIAEWFHDCAPKPSTRPQPTL